MMYPALGVVTAASFYLGVLAKRDWEEREKEKERQAKAEAKVEVVKPQHSFREGAVGDYIERRQEENKFVVYSKHHKCALATHQYLDKKTLEKEQASRATKLAVLNLEAVKGSEAKLETDAKEAVEATTSAVEETPSS